MKSLTRVGFTLIELMAVLLILALSASVVMTRMAARHEGAVLEAEARKIRRTLMYARERALLERTPMHFVLLREGAAYGIEKEGGETGALAALPKGLSLAGEAVVFFPRGDATGGELVLSDRSGRGYAIRIDPATAGSAIERVSAEAP